MTREDAAELGTILEQARDVFPPREYSKECWIAVYAAATAQGMPHFESRQRADMATDVFNGMNFS